MSDAPLPLGVHTAGMTLLEQILHVLPEEPEHGPADAAHLSTLYHQTGLLESTLRLANVLGQAFPGDSQAAGDTEYVHPLTGWYGSKGSRAPTPRLMRLPQVDRDRLLGALKSALLARGWAVTFALQRSNLTGARALVARVNRRVALPPAATAETGIADLVADWRGWDTSAFADAPAALSDSGGSLAAVGTVLPDGRRSFDLADLTTRILPAFRRANRTRWAYWPSAEHTLRLTLLTGLLAADPDSRGHRYVTTGKTPTVLPRPSFARAEPSGQPSETRATSAG